MVSGAPMTSLLPVVIGKPSGENHSLKKKGSAQEFDRAPISCGFLKGHEFYLRCRQALGLQ